MIATSPRQRVAEVTTSEAHVRAVAGRFGLHPTRVGRYLYVARVLPSLTLVYRCVVGDRPAHWDDGTDVLAARVRAVS